MNIPRYQLSFILFAVAVCWLPPLAFSQQVGRITITPDAFSASENSKYKAPVKIPARMPDELYFPKSLRGRPSKFLTASQRLEIQSNLLGDKYHDKLDDTHPFAGLYAVGRVNHRVSNLGRQGNPRNDYLYGLEWDIFRRGYHEYKRDLDEKKIASKVQALQVTRAMRMRALDEQLFHLNSLRRAVQTLSSKKMLDLTTIQLKMAKKQMAHGYITRDEYEDNVNRQLDAKIRYTRLAANSLVKVPPIWFRMLNVAPALRLAPEKQLFEQAVRVSPDLLLQGQFEKRADFFPEWMDNVSLDLFVHRRRRFGGNAENVVGAQVRIPLDIQPYREDVVSIEKESYRVQASAIRARLKQKISQLSSEFQFQQARVAQLADDYADLKKKIISSKKLAKIGIPYLKQTPEKDIAMYKRDQLMTVENVWLARIDVLEKVLRLAAMTHARREKELFMDEIADHTSNKEKAYKPSMVLYNKVKAQTKVKEGVPNGTLVHQAIITAVESWRAAWSAKKQKTYFLSYAEGFKPEHHDTVAIWKKNKQRLFVLRKSIDVKLFRTQVKLMNNYTRARVRFYQLYRAGKYHSSDAKELLMQRIGGAWKIIREHRIQLNMLDHSTDSHLPTTKPIQTDIVFKGPTTTDTVVNTVSDRQGLKKVTLNENKNDKQAILNAVDTWRRAWESKDMPRYFRAYADAFKPFSQGKRWTLREWKKYKKRVISDKKYIKIVLHDMHVSQKGSRAFVQFQQEFTSNNYSSRDDKDLIFLKQTDGWKIVQEKVL